MSRTEFNLLQAASLPSPARTLLVERGILQVGAVQTKWHKNLDEHLDALARGIRLAAANGAQIICLQELTLSPYFALQPDVDGTSLLEEIPSGRTTKFALEIAKETGSVIHASLYERDLNGGIGFNTAIAVSPDSTLLAQTRKLHIPCFPGYHEDCYFAAGDTGFPVVEALGTRFGFPTCWDQWFPELARTYSLAGAEILVYPTAIGSETNAPDFDTQPMWSQMICANGLANATFMIAINRIGTETIGQNSAQFYGSSFISDPCGRVLVQAPRDSSAVLVADLDLDQRRDMLEFGLFSTRRPELYKALTTPLNLKGQL